MGYQAISPTDNLATTVIDLHLKEDNEINELITNCNTSNENKIYSNNLLDDNVCNWIDQNQINELNDFHMKDKDMLDYVHKYISEILTNSVNIYLSERQKYNIESFLELGCYTVTLQ